MLVPLQYQSQFIPTDFGTVENVLGMYRQDMGQREQQFDQGVAMETQAIADLGALAAFDEEAKQERLNTISSLLQEAVNKRGGDYGSASRDIARIIASERANPWYQTNREQQEAIKNYNQLKMNADNVVIGDPRIKYQDYKKAVAEGKNPFQVSALSKSNLYKQASDIASNFANRLQTDPSFRKTLGGQYFEVMKQYGVSPENFEAFINTGEGSDIMGSILAANPELQGANMDVVKEVVKQGLYSAIGKSDNQYVANRGYIDPYDRYRMSNEENTGGAFPLQQTGYGLVPESVNDFGNRVYKNLGDNLAREEAKKLGITGINSFEDLQNIIDKSDKSKQEYRADKAMAVGFTPGIDYRPYKDDPNRSKAEIAIANINQRLADKGQGTGLPTYNINTIISANPTKINQLKTVRDELNQNLQTDIKTKFTPMTSEDEKEFKKIKKNSQIVDIATNFNKEGTGLIFYIQGEDKDGEIVNATVVLNPQEKLIENKYVGLMNQLNPIIGIEKQYADSGEDYLKYLETEVYPNVKSESGKQAIAMFINSKRATNVER